MCHIVTTAVLTRLVTALAADGIVTYGYGKLLVYSKEVIMRVNPGIRCFDSSQSTIGFLLVCTHGWLERFPTWNGVCHLGSAVYMICSSLLS